MKNFNQMTEAQMGKTEGGLLSLLCTVFCCFTAAASIAGGVTNAAKNNK